MQPGRCLSCRGWLGVLPAQSQDGLKGAKHEPTEYDVFISKEIGALIASAPDATSKLKQRVPKAVISELVNRCFDGKTRPFTRYLGLSRSADWPLTSARMHRMVGLSLLLKLAFVSQTRLLSLLTNEEALLTFSPTIVIRPKQPSLLVTASKEHVLAGLTAAVHETPAPSLAEVSARLGRAVSRLRQHSPETCKLITKNFLKSDRGKEALTGKAQFRLRSKSEIEKAFKTALKQEPPPTLDQVARSLGYRNRFTLKYRVPDLCHALLQRHPKPHEVRKQFVESELRKSLERNPPESLLIVAQRLDYRSTHDLSITYKELARKVRSRFEDYEKRQFQEQARLKLAAILSEIPPPTLKDTLHRLGHSDGWMRAHFPEERRSIVARYLALRREQSKTNKDRDRKRIKTIVREFHAKGTFPSMNAVLDVFSASALKRTEVWATIKQAREELLEE